MENHDIILVNEKDEQIGTMEKMEVHEKALLHRAFSVFIFSSNGELLLQQRALTKYHSPGLWTNACCSHPRPGEETHKAAERRMQEEMGFCTTIQKVSEFIYKASFDNGLTEYEYDHVFVGYFDGDIAPDPEEVNDYNYRTMESIAQSLISDPQNYTAWFHIAFPLIEKWVLQNTLTFNAR